MTPDPSPPVVSLDLPGEIDGKPAVFRMRLRLAWVWAAVVAVDGLVAGAAVWMTEIHDQVTGMRADLAAIKSAIVVPAKMAREP